MPLFSTQYSHIVFFLADLSYFFEMYLYLSYFSSFNFFSIYTRSMWHLFDDLFANVTNIEIFNIFYPYFLPYCAIFAEF